MSQRADSLTDAVHNELDAQATPAPLGFDQLFTVHHRAVYRLAYALVRDAALAEDVSQEVFLKLYRHLRNVPHGEAARAWLLRVTINIARNTLRGKNGTTHREEEFSASVAGATEHSLVEAPDEGYERRAQIEETRRALDLIREPMRSCLLLKHQGLSYREIAAVLALKETNVGSLVARGRKEFIKVYRGIGEIRK